MKTEYIKEIGRLKDENKRLREELAIREQNDAFHHPNWKNSSFLICMLDTDLRFTFLSPAFIKEYAILTRKKVVVGQKITEILQKINSAKWENYFSQVLSGKELVVEETLIRNKVKKHVHIFISPTKYEGKISGAQILINEIPQRTQTEIKEIDSLKKLQQIFNQIQDLYYEIDLGGKITEVSPAIKNFSSYSRKELIGSDINALYQNKKDREVFIKTIKKHGKVKDYIIHIRDKNMKVKSVSINATLIFDNQGRPSKIAGILRDVTEVEHINNDLRWLRRAFEQSPVSILITDIKGNIEYSNPFFTKTSGYSKEEVIGKNPSLLKSGQQDAAFYSLLWTTITRGGTWEGELHNKRKNGELFWEKAIISPVKNAQDEIVNFIAVKEDITKQMLATNAIIRLKTFNERIINTIHDGILVEDKEGTIIYTNPAFTSITGFSSDELIGKNWKMVVAPNYHEVIANTRTTTNNDFAGTIEAEILKKENDTVLTLVGNSPIYEDDHYQGTISVFTDISNLKKNEKKLKKALQHAQLSDKLKSSFLANMSHEIRTPMNAILGFSDILRNERDLEEDLRNEYFNIIEDKGNELLQIISDIIDISKIESKIIDIKNDEFDLKCFFKEIFNAFEKEIRISGKPISLKLNLPENTEPILITTDRYRFNQVFINLLINARKFTEQGEIEFGFRLKSKKYEFYVRDTGIGISPKDQKIIFDRFRQVEDNYTRGFGGTGLGLNICKNLLKLLGGKIWVESKLQSGSTFYFTLPVYKRKRAK